MPTPPYAQRICFMFISFGQGMTTLLCLINTEDVRKSLMHSIRKMKRRRRQRRMLCISVIGHPVQMVPVDIA